MKPVAFKVSVGLGCFGCFRVPVFVRLWFSFGVFRVLGVQVIQL